MDERGDIMDYREQIYKKYTEHLKCVTTARNLEKERMLVRKYFKKNYLKYFPHDKGCKILDVGCGLGSYIVAAKTFGYENVEGVDASQAVIQFCRGEGLQVTGSQAQEFLMNREGIYDIIMFNDMIEHLNKQEVVDILRLMKKALRKGGKIIIKVVNAANPITGNASRYIDFTHELGFTEVSLRQVLNAVGFQKVSIKGTDIYLGYMPMG